MMHIALLCTCSRIAIICVKKTVYFINRNTLENTPPRIQRFGTALLFKAEFLFSSIREWNVYQGLSVCFESEFSLIYNLRLRIRFSIVQDFINLLMPGNGI
jgi:hypothetical protein